MEKPSTRQMAQESSDVATTVILTITSPGRRGAVEMEDLLRLNPELYGGFGYLSISNSERATFLEVRQLDAVQRAEAQLGTIRVGGRDIVVHIDHLRSLPRLYAMFVEDEDEFNAFVSLDVDIHALSIVLLTAYGILSDGIDDHLFHGWFAPQDFLEALKLVEQWGGIREVSDEIIRLMYVNAEFWKREDNNFPHPCLNSFFGNLALSVVYLTNETCRLMRILTPSFSETALLQQVCLHCTWLLRSQDNRSMNYFSETTTRSNLGYGS
ncbi:hypothetical protein K449DRAFT_398319 [Hypoxylon sp. EC38]|nr:hypothetical protein K449DRAFT_398319 [Hypoxylon sp. EC38]